VDVAEGEGRRVGEGGEDAGVGEGVEAGQAQDVEAVGAGGLQRGQERRAGRVVEAGDRGKARAGRAEGAALVAVAGEVQDVDAAEVVEAGGLVEAVGGGGDAARRGRGLAAGARGGDGGERAVEQVEVVDERGEGGEQRGFVEVSGDVGDDVEVGGAAPGGQRVVAQAELEADGVARGRQGEADEEAALGVGRAVAEDQAGGERGAFGEAPQGQRRVGGERDGGGGRGRWGQHTRR
jgi:hypothetical protein